MQWELWLGSRLIPVGKSQKASWQWHLLGPWEPKILPRRGHGEHHDHESFSLCVFNINLNQTSTIIDGFSLESLLVWILWGCLIPLLHCYSISNFFSISLHSVLFLVNIYPLSALRPDHILANYSICHCKLNCGFHSYQIQFSQIS